MGPIELYFHTITIFISIALILLALWIIETIHLRVVAPGLNDAVRATINQKKSRYVRKDRQPSSNKRSDMYRTYSDSQLNIIDLDNVEIDDNDELEREIENVMEVVIKDVDNYSEKEEFQKSLSKVAEKEMVPIEQPPFSRNTSKDVSIESLDFPARVNTALRNNKVDTIEKLIKITEAGQLRNLRGIGPKTEDIITETVKKMF